MVQYTTSQAMALAPKGIRANAVAPGSIEFPGGTWEKRKQEGSPVYNAVLNACKQAGISELGISVRFLPMKK